MVFIPGRDMNGGGILGFLNGILGPLESVVRGILESPISPDVAATVVGALGFVNAFLIYVLARVVTRPVYVSLQRVAAIIMAALVLSLVLGIADLLIPSLVGLPNIFLKSSLLLWLAGLLLLMGLTTQVLTVDRIRFRKPSRTTIGLRNLVRRLGDVLRLKSNDSPLPSLPFEAFENEFGVTCVDQYLEEADSNGMNVYFPVLLVAEKHFRPWRIANRFAAAALKHEEGVIYFSFNQPPSIVVGQIARQFSKLHDPATKSKDWWEAADGQTALANKSFERLLIVDCYSRWIGRVVAQPESLKEYAELSNQVQVLKSDPRNPKKLAKHYKRALTRLLYDDIRTTRVVYDSISDFLVYTDPQLAVQFLKHNMVWEDAYGANSLYVYVPGVPKVGGESVVDEQFLRWNSYWVIQMKHTKDDRDVMTVEGLLLRRVREEIRMDQKSRDYFVRDTLPDADNLDRPLAALDSDQIKEFAASLARFNFQLDEFDDPLLYPEGDMDAASANFFFLLVAIDHRTHSPGKPFQGRVNGVNLHGAELMWALAKKRFTEDPAFFEPERLAHVDAEQISELFQIDTPEPVQISGAEERAELLRDCAQKLVAKFEGSILNLISRSGEWMIRQNGKGFLQQLGVFSAYEDPLSKKSFLLAKFLERRGLLRIRDPENLHVPVDNVLQRVALRAGLVQLKDEDLDKKVRQGLTVTDEEEMKIRKQTMAAFDAVADELRISPTRLDDVLWELGRAHCHVPTPICDQPTNDDFKRAYRIIAAGPVTECPFGMGCQGYQRPERWELKEPNFLTAFY